MTPKKSKPAYVEYGGLTTAPGPLVCEGTKLQTFFVKADKAKLRALTAQLFDEPSGGEVDARPMFGAVQFTFGRIERITPASPFDRKGGVTELQTAIWVPSLVMPRVRSPRRLPFPASAIPYIWLEDPLSIATGREMYGYPKNYGHTIFPGEQPGVGNPDAYRLTGYAIEKEGPKASPKESLLFEMAPKPRSAAAAADPEGAEGREFKSFRELARHVAGVLMDKPEDEPAAEELRDLRLPEPTINQLFLRQFRDPENGLLASQQQVVKAPAVIKDFKGARLLGGHDFNLYPHDSHPIGDQLGIADGPTLVAFEVEFDFVITEGEVLWSST